MADLMDCLRIAGLVFGTAVAVVLTVLVYVAGVLVAATIPALLVWLGLGAMGVAVPYPVPLLFTAALLAVLLTLREAP